MTNVIKVILLLLYDRKVDITTKSYLVSNTVQNSVKQFIKQDLFEEFWRIYFLHENEFKIVLLANPSNLNASSAPRTAVLSGCNRIASFLYALLTSSWVDPGSIPNCCQAFCPLPNLDITACWSVLGCGRVVSLQLEK